MPKFVDNSYVMRDVKKMQKDIQEYHDQNQLRIYNELKEVFLSRELDTYDQVDKLVKQLQESSPDSSDRLSSVWTGYREMINNKQFFIREECNDIISIEALLDLCNQKGVTDKEELQEFLKKKLEGLEVDGNELYDGLMADDYMDTRLRPFYRNYQGFVLEKMSHKYEKLYKNFAGIFFKVIARTMEMDRLEKMLNMIKNVETGRMTQHNASVMVGKELGEKYLKNMK